LFVAVNVTVPDEPGVTDGDDTDTDTSAERAPAVSVEGDTVLFAGTGSADTVDTDAEPPEITPGTCAAPNDTGIDTDVDAPLANEPATVHDTVPDTNEQPPGNVPNVTADGGVYENVTGPTASDGPSSVAVNTTTADVPGVTDGDDTDNTTSAERTPAVTDTDPELFTLDGSDVVDTTDTKPPATTPGTCDAANDTGITTDTEPPLTTSPATTHDTVPDANVQPAPSAPIVTPAAGVYVKVIGPAAVDGPLFTAVTSTVPVAPGVIVGDEALTARSAFGVPAVMVVGLTVLSAVAGSVVVVATEAEPPEIGPVA
jgi:hypothetical protein